MNTDKLLDIINCILTEKNIYELFKNHGYGESFENLQKDLANLLDKFIVTDGELNEVAGGRANALTRVSSGILASIASFSGMNFVGAQTLKEEQSKSQRVLNNIKETGVNSSKKAAKFVINNGGKIAGGGTLFATWSLLCALIGRHTKKVPVVETKDMTEDEKKLIRFAQEVLKKIYDDITLGSKKYFNSEQDNYQNLKELITNSKQLGGIPAISGEVRVGDLVANLLPEPKENSTQAYRDGRDDLIKNEKDNIALTKNLIKQHSNETEQELREQLKELATEHRQQKNRLEQIEQEKKDLQEKMDNADNTHKEELEKIEKEKETLETEMNNAENAHKEELDKIAKEKEKLKTQLISVSEEKNKVEQELEILKQESNRKKNDIENKDLQINNQQQEIKELKKKATGQESEIQSLQNKTIDLNQKLALEREKEENAKKTEQSLIDRVARLNQELGKQKEDVSLTKWNGIGEYTLATLTCEEKTNRLNAWLVESKTIVNDTILKSIREFFFEAQETFNVPEGVLASYDQSIFGKLQVGWAWGINYVHADSLDCNQLRTNFVDTKLWLKLFEGLEESKNEKNVDLVFVLFQACRLVGWSFVPETICKALLEHYKYYKKNAKEYNPILRKRIAKLLDSCGLRLENNGVYLKDVGVNQSPVFC